MKSIIKWILLVIIFIVIFVLGARSAKDEIHKTEQEDAKTEMLIIQGKAKIILENYHINNENGIKGEKMEDTSLEEKYGISEIGNFYKWTRETVVEQGIPFPILKDNEYYLVNYDTEEIVYSGGYKAEDGNTYYKLSDIKNVESKLIEETNATEEVQPAEESQSAEEPKEEVRENEGEGTNQTEQTEGN